MRLPAAGNSALAADWRCPLDAPPGGSLHTTICAFGRHATGGRWRMARIKHIALVTDDPAKTAEFYKENFGLTELYRRPTDTGEKGVWLSDGYIYFAILKYGDADAPKLGPGQSSELRGIHHIGFQVDDLEATARTLQEANVPPVPRDKRDMRDPTPMATISEGAANLKYLGP